MAAQDFYDVMPEKFQNKTNGVTPRRWLAWCNPALAALITEALGGDEWINDATRLAGLRKFADDKGFQAKWRAIKHENKERLAAKIKVRLPCGVPPAGVQVQLGLLRLAVLTALMQAAPVRAMLSVEQLLCCHMYLQCPKEQYVASLCVPALLECNSGGTAM